jgi:hypothetical protein
MVGVLIGAVLAALTFAVCTELDMPPELGILCAVIVLVASVPMIGDRFGFRDL